MNKQILKRIRLAGKLLAITLPLSIGAFIMLSFSVLKMADDFLQQLGISKTNADSKIVNSILGGSLDGFGVRNAKNIAVGNRSAVTKDLLNYVKTHVSSAAFIKAYSEDKLRHKPTLLVTKSPEAMQAEQVESNKKSLAELEANYKKADASMKPVFEKIIVEAKKQLAESEDPNSKTNQRYRNNYPQSLKFAEQSNQRMLAEWEAKYPSNHLLFIKNRMQQFLDETNNIDFDAELISKNGKRVFVNKAYESKGNRWKMGFRAGKEVVETARTYVQTWMTEIK